MPRPLRLLIAAGAIATLTLGVATAALAHDFTVEGDCGGWTLVLDGLYGAHHLTIDGVDSTLQLVHHFSDTGPDLQRTFTVFWDKAENDVTKTHSGTRTGDCDTTSTTAVTVPTTSTTEVPPSSTTTSVTIPTTEPPTVVTQPPTTPSTIAECPPGQVHNPPFCEEPVGASSAQVEGTTTILATVETLPFTGAESSMVGLGAALAAGGAILLAASRRVEEKTARRSWNG